MEQRLYSGSILGLDREMRHSGAANPFTRIFLDEAVDKKRLVAAISEALLDCPYMGYAVTEEEGIFLRFEERKEPLPLLNEEPSVINSPENHGHSAAVSCRENRITVMVSHALTDGCGLFWFVRTLLDRYFGVEEKIYPGSEAPEYARDLLEDELPVSEDFKPMPKPEGPFFTVTDPKKPDFSNTFLLRTSYPDYKGLCKTLDGSTQNVLTAIALTALSEAYPKNTKKMTARFPINARRMFGIPYTFQNSSLANIRVTFSPEALKDPKNLIKEIEAQSELQNTKDAVADQCNRWRGVLMAENREERMKRIVPLIGQDAILISNLGKGLVSDSYAHHITAMLPGAMMFPLMLYGTPWGDRMGFSGYDAGNGAYKDALRSVLERMGLSIEECDPATGKAI